MAILVLAPILEEVKDREDLAFWMLLQVAINGDVAPVANLLTQISGVEDEFRLEEGIGLAGGQEAQVQLQPKISHGFIEEAGMAGLIARHVGKALGKQRVFGFDAAAELLVEQEA